MIALEYESAKQIAIVVIVVLVLGSLITAKIVANVTKKFIAIAILLVVAVGVWSQRQSLQTCKSKIGAGDTATCSFFGKDVEISIPRGG